MFMGIKEGFSHARELIDGERNATAPLLKRELRTKSNLHVHETATISVFYGPRVSPPQSIVTLRHFEFVNKHSEMRVGKSYG